MYAPDSLCMCKGGINRKASLATCHHQPINYVMGADDYDTNYKDDDCIYVKHFKGLVSINRQEYKSTKGLTNEFSIKTQQS